MPILKKAFGNLVYQNVEDFDFKYCLPQSGVDDSDTFKERG